MHNQSTNALSALHETSYRPLTHQQIAKYANDPWWQNLRHGLMISFWASMALMVLAAVLIAVIQHEHVCMAGKSIRPMIVAPGGGVGFVGVGGGPNVSLSSDSGGSNSASNSGSNNGNNDSTGGGDVLAIVSSETSASVRDLRGSSLGIDWLLPI